MRVLIVTSFAIPREYDGTAMLLIKIWSALRSRGMEVVMADSAFREPNACLLVLETIEAAATKFNLPLTMNLFYFLLLPSLLSLFSSSLGSLRALR